MVRGDREILGKGQVTNVRNARKIVKLIKYNELDVI
jgi:hypothetical protein